MASMTSAYPKNRSHRYRVYVLVGCLINIFLLVAVFRSHFSSSTVSSDTKGTKAFQNGKQTSISEKVPQHSNKIIKQRPVLSLALSPSECRANFPGLFDEIDSSVARLATTGNITTADIDISWKSTGVARVLIFNNKVLLRSHTSSTL